MTRVVVNPARPEGTAIEQAAGAIRRGLIVAVPTDTIYGLAANPFDRAAVARVFEAKGRKHDQPLPLIASDLSQIEGSLGMLPPLARGLAARFWPGPLTLLIGAPPTLAPEVTAGTGRVGVRIPNHAVARELCKAAGGLLTATSANVSGQPATADPDVVAATLAPYVELLLDAGPAPGGAPSTIVGLAGSRIELIRAGAIPWETIETCRPA
jgi:L-threonylcarbamoyladenylate synthase